MLTWTIYEIQTATTSIHGVMLRGRLRKLGLRDEFDVLCENATDKENCVRFAVLNKTNAVSIKNYLLNIIPDVNVTEVAHNIANPVLSKLKVNKEERYTL